MSFRVDLDIFRGPLDLLLFLVRKHEMDVVDLPIAPIAEQFVRYMEVLEKINVDAVGDFLEMASTLAEIKSRMCLPHGGEEEEAEADPRQELVRQLLEYKKFKDAASILDERSRAWQERFPRLSRDIPARERNLADEPIHELELWDLVSAFGRIMREHQSTQSTNIVYDETPIHIFMGRVHRQLMERQRVTFSELFQPGMHRSTLVGIFLAVLELVRHHGVRTEQGHLFGEIEVIADGRTSTNLDFAPVDDYEHPAGSA
ncbi:MAG: ScpA family protein [Pirellulales bacterium]